MISQTRHDALAFIRQNKSILLIVCIGFITRLVYTIFFSNYVAQHYFGHASFFENSSDFSAWVDALKNFIQTGTYTVNPDNELGYFGRMPGYALFIAPFYCLFGEHHFTYVISFAQLVLDTINIYMIYRIFKQLLPDSSFPYIAPFIYAINPINILWSSALFSEGLSVFFLVLCIYLYTCSFH
ncbi:MAG TPA: hypothetical protein VK750_07050, partial [Cytophagaceae bacterium]|nr:hypothetical protein [Cytophagaceae bacterium]